MMVFLVQNGIRWSKVGESGIKAGRQMLVGQYEGIIDAKNRIAMPKRFREVLGDQLILSFGFENSLIVVSEDKWNTLLEGTEGRPFLEVDTRTTQRFLLGNASFVKLDSKGRLIVPVYLKKYAQIEKEVVFVGLSRFVEIWNKRRWEEYNKHLEKTISNISQRLVEKGETRD